MFWVRVGISSWKILRCVINSYPCMPGVPAADNCNAQAVLGSAATALVGMEKASCSGHATNCGRVASCWFSAVLEMALPSPAVGEAGEQGDSSADLSHGGREPDVGSAPHSWRAAEAGFSFIGANGLTLASTSVENSRSGPALADVSAEPSRGHCNNGFLHRTDNRVWCPVLLLHHRPRPTKAPLKECCAGSVVKVQPLADSAVVVTTRLAMGDCPPSCVFRPG